MSVLRIFAAREQVEVLCSPSALAFSRSSSLGEGSTRVLPVSSHTFRGLKKSGILERWEISGQDGPGVSQRASPRRAITIRTIFVREAEP